MFPLDDARKQAIEAYKAIYQQYHGTEALTHLLQSKSTEQIVTMTSDLQTKYDLEINPNYTYDDSEDYDQYIPETVQDVSHTANNPFAVLGNLVK